MFRIAGPAERDSDARKIIKLELRETVADLPGSPFAIGLALHCDMHHREIAHREHVRVWQINGLAADLHGELRRPDHGGADTLAGIDQWQPGTGAKFAGEFMRERLRDVAEAAAF